MMPYFSIESTNRLASCDKKLWNLFQEVVKHFDCSILCGHRGEADQNEAYDNGFSKVRWPDSLHNTYPSRAVDAAPYINGQPLLHDREALCLFAGYVLGIARSMNIDIIWGGDWNDNHLVRDERFQDLYHFQLRT
jgi:peptidoglycan L-alanyl-D-glutamate endopeptidase CwlK